MAGWDTQLQAAIDGLSPEELQIPLSRLRSTDEIIASGDAVPEELRRLFALLVKLTREGERAELRLLIVEDVGLRLEDEERAKVAELRMLRRYAMEALLALVQELRGELKGPFAFRGGWQLGEDHSPLVTSGPPERTRRWAAGPGARILRRILHDHG